MEHGETPRESGETHNRPRAFALVSANLSCVGWPSSSSSLARTVRLGVGERRRREIAIGHLSDRGPRRLPVSVECSRPPTTTRVSAVTAILFVHKNPSSPCLSHFLAFIPCAGVTTALNIRGSSGETTRRSDIGLGRSSDAHPLANWKPRFLATKLFFLQFRCFDATHGCRPRRPPLGYVTEGDRRYDRYHP